MTDVPSELMSVPSRLGASARLDGSRLVIDVLPQPATLHHGIVRASVLSFAVDAVAGISIDQDPTLWAFTTDMSVRMRPVPAPDCISAVNTVLREGRRSVTCRVDLHDPAGGLVAAGAIGFAKVPRKDSDPPKPALTPEDAAVVFRDLGTLSLPLRDEAGIEVVDAAEGIVEVEVVPALLNPAGTLQGAMVMLLAECATEEVAASRADAPVVVTELDVRYLDKARSGTVRTRTRRLGDAADDPVQVELVDTGTGRVTALVHARATILR